MLFSDANLLRRIMSVAEAVLFFAVIAWSTTVSKADVPAPILADPRTVASRSVIDGHVVTIEALTSLEARRLPRSIFKASIDGLPDRWYAVGRIVARPKGLEPSFPGGMMVALDPTQGNGNFPGVVSVTPAANGNLVLASGSTASAVVLDLGQSISLGGATAITLSSTSGATIKSSGTGTGNTGLRFVTTGTPGSDAYLFSVNNNPTGNVLNVEDQSGSSLLAIGEGETVITAGTSSSIPLVVRGATNQSNSIVQYYNSAGGAEILDLQPTGTLTVETASDVVGFIIDGASSGQNNDLMRAFTKSGGTEILSFTSAGGLEIAPTVGTSHTLSYVPPVYTSSGSSVQSTLHAVVGTCSFSSSTTCGVSLTNAAVFNSASSYACSASWTVSDTTHTLTIENQAASSFTLSASGSQSHTAAYMCLGT